MRIFDTHAHYDSGAFNGDRMEVLASMPEQGVELILNPGCDLESSRTAVALADAFPHVYAAVGFHPSDCEGWSDAAREELRALAANPKVKAIISEVITSMAAGIDTVKKGSRLCAVLICSIDAPGVIIEGKKVTPVK